MAETISAADAKAHFAELVSRVEDGGEQIIIERRGKPVAALVSVSDLSRLEESSSDGEPAGLLALAGTWADILTDDEVDAFVEHIYSERERDLGRPVDLGD